ncbi:septum formation inhibitor Maf [Ornithinibacillus sp. L9]|uniref:dTTP/UTP pyrophosphatase n=1 Tax=Ornithinibacillus caprae TaxID=2678566 RepID=A0A6N8FGY3_9BACI|nr:Maf family protein [Ornithinibacillus caprae]MUK88830.1 septum formation inhibitor Maf [Ornithinibacillus caprae]
MSNKLILASSSPRRQELLQQAMIPFSTRKQSVDETQIISDDPVEKVRKLATLKGKNAVIHHDDEVILAADTVVSFKQRIFEKPVNQDNAFQMLTALSGNTHEVYTGVMIRSLEKEIVFVEKTSVEFWTLSEEDINWYISTQEPYDKAGAYGIQSMGAILVKKIIGDYYNVVGLPISRVVRELRSFSIYPQK